MDTYDILHNKFDLQTHSDNFINYLEIIIRQDGTVEYAVPSHQQKLESIAKEMYGVAKFYYMVNDVDIFCDYLKWLCQITNCVSVWNDFCYCPVKCSVRQIKTLTVLSHTFYTKMPNCALYQGKIPKGAEQ